MTRRASDSDSVCVFWSAPSFSVDAASSSPWGKARLRCVAGGNWTLILGFVRQICAVSVVSGYQSQLEAVGLAMVLCILLAFTDIAATDPMLLDVECQDRTTRENSLNEVWPGNCEAVNMFTALHSKEW